MQAPRDSSASIGIPGLSRPLGNGSQWKGEGGICHKTGLLSYPASCSCHREGQAVTLPHRSCSFYQEDLVCRGAKSMKALPHLGSFVRKPV